MLPFFQFHYKALVIQQSCGNNIIEITTTDKRLNATDTSYKIKYYDIYNNRKYDIHSNGELL